MADSSSSVLLCYIVIAISIVIVIYLLRLI